MKSPFNISSSTESTHYSDDGYAVPSSRTVESGMQKCTYIVHKEVMQCFMHRVLGVIGKSTLTTTGRFCIVRVRVVLSVSYSVVAGEWSGWELL